MPFRRILQGNDGFALHRAVEWLIGEYEKDRFVDLHDVVVVFPGARAGRRFRELLLERFDGQKLGYLPPRITTVGKLPELLYRPQRPFASDLVQDLAWTNAIRHQKPADIQQIVAKPPAADNLSSWLDIGRLLRMQHRELAGDQLSFSDVADHGHAVRGFNEHGRWQALATIQRRCLDTLDQLGLWDRQTARLVAIQRQECHIDGQIVLVGTADMNKTLRSMLQQVGDRVTALIQAPPDWADRFDEFGCVVPAAWRDAHIELADDQIRTAEGPVEQAKEVVRAISQLNGRFATSDIAIGILDENLVHHVKQQLKQHGAVARWGPGRRASELAPYKLLECLADLLDRNQFEDLASFVRHPDVMLWLERDGVPCHWISELDSLHEELLPLRLTANLVIKQKRQNVGRVAENVERLRDRFRESAPPGDWANRISEALLEIYGPRRYDLDDPVQKATVDVCQELRDAAQELAELPTSLVKEMTARVAIDLVLQKVASLDVPEPACEDALELLGWLELPLDDSPVTIVTSVNDGFVPSVVNFDAFLPNRLRSQLGLDDNQRRYARDAYALSTLLASRDRICLIVGQHDREGNPLTPSRLLFATNARKIAERTLRLMSESSGNDRDDSGGGSYVASSSILRIPRPATASAPVARLSPTAIRDYLACPYRFYLRHVLGLRPVADDALEMDGRRFGSVIHEVLRRFGNSGVRDSTFTEEIAEFLHDQLDTCGRTTFADHPMPAVRVQIEQIRLRLSAFAEVQAERARQGWRIEQTEVPSLAEDRHMDLEVDGHIFRLTGRIDRIDVHSETEQRVVLDYKTGDSGKSPRETHLKGEEWIDLQLPLYRHIAKSLGIDGPLELGYVLLPKDTGQTAFRIAEWNDAELADADRCARRVVQCIQDGLFWPPREQPTSHQDDYAWICQRDVLDRERVETRHHEPLSTQD